LYRFFSIRRISQCIQSAAVIVLIGISLSQESRAEEFLICRAGSPSTLDPFIDAKDPDPRLKRVKKLLHRLVGDDLNSFAGVTPDIHFSDESTPNAFVNEAHTIVLSEGLMKIVQNDDELAFVLAHELAHIALHHNRPSGHRSHALIGSGTALQGLIRREIAADRLALSILRSSGLDPDVGLALLERLSSFGWETGRPLAARYPSLEARVEALEEQLNIQSCSVRQSDEKRRA
jgi:Zn-dependent protease with chaperone function